MNELHLFDLDLDLKLFRCLSIFLSRLWVIISFSTSDSTVPICSSSIGGLPSLTGCSPGHIDEYVCTFVWMYIYLVLSRHWLMSCALETGATEVRWYKIRLYASFLFGRVQDGPMVEMNTRLCLEASARERVVKLRPCNFPLYHNQTWRFAHYTEKYSDLIKRNKTNFYGNIRNILLRTMNNSSSIATQSPTLRWICNLIFILSVVTSCFKLQLFTIKYF